MKVLEQIEPIALSMLPEESIVLDLSEMKQSLWNRPFESSEVAEEIWFDFIQTFQQFWEKDEDFPLAFSAYEPTPEEVDEVFDVEQYSPHDQAQLFDWMNETFCQTPSYFRTHTHQPQSVYLVKHPTQARYVTAKTLSPMSHQLFI